MLFAKGDKVKMKEHVLDFPTCHPRWRELGTGTVIGLPSPMQMLGFMAQYGFMPSVVVNFPGVDEPLILHGSMLDLVGERPNYPLRFNRGDLVQATGEFCACERCDHTLGTIEDITTSVGGASTEGDYTVKWDDGLTTRDYDFELVPAGFRQESVAVPDTKVKVGDRVRNTSAPSPGEHSVPVGTLGTVTEIYNKDAWSYQLASELLGYKPDLEVQWDVYPGYTSNGISAWMFDDLEAE